MSEVKWIKLQTDIFDNRKIRQLEKLPDGDSLIVMWLKLLVLAGNVNDNGFVYFTKDIPYTDQLLATQFDRPLTTVQLALDMFQKFGMIEVVDDIIHVSNWEKYQNIDELERLKELNRQRQKRWYDKAHAESLPKPNVSLTLDLTQPNGTDIDIDKEVDKEVDNELDLFGTIVSAWNEVGISPIRSIVPQSERAKLLKARIKEQSFESVLEAISKIRNSDFLRGQNKNGWTITFDWFIRPRNFQKVLEGNYDNRGEKNGSSSNSRGAQNSSGSSGWDIHYD